MATQTARRLSSGKGVLAALVNAQTPAQRSLEWIRLGMLLLCLAGWAIYPVELIILDHWTENWQAKVPFILAIPAFILTVWVLFDRRTPWVRTAFVVVMWLAVATGLAGAMFHLLWNFDGEVNWAFEETMAAMEGSRPVLAALAFTHMGLTSLLSIYRAR